MTSIVVKGKIGQRENSFDYIESILDEANPNDPINLRIDSPGGNYMQAVRISHRLSKHPGEKVIDVDPLAGSAGAVLALTPGARVRIPANGFMMHHAPELKGGSKNAEELSKAAEDLGEISKSLTEMVVARTGKTSEEVTTMLNKGRWFNAQSAKEYGLVDEITPLTRHRFDVRNLTVPDEIVNEIQSFDKELDAMKLKELCGELKLEVTDEMEDEQFSELVVNRVGDLETELTTTKTELTETQTKLEEAEKKIPKKSGKSLPKSIVNIISKDRNFEIDNLVSTGKIIPAVAEDLKKSFVDPEELINMIDDEGESIDNFETVVSALKKNEEVVNFGGQKFHKLPKPDEAEDNPLLADADRRAKAGR